MYPNTVIPSKILLKIVIVGEKVVMSVKTVSLPPDFSCGGFVSSVLKICCCNTQLFTNARKMYQL